jgi:hypothetical protein
MNPQRLYREGCDDDQGMTRELPARPRPDPRHTCREATKNHQKSATREVLT